MDNTKEESVDITKRTSGWSAWRVISWSTGCCGALVLLPVMGLMGLGTFLTVVECIRGREFPPAIFRLSSGLELLTPENSKVEVLASKRSDSMKQNARIEEYIIRLHSDDECESFVQQMLRRNKKARDEAPNSPPEEAVLYSQFEADYGGGDGDRYMFELYSECPYNIPRSNEVYAEKGVNHTWYVYYINRHKD